MKDVQSTRTSKIIMWYVIKSKHEINWMNTECLEKESRKIIRYIIEGIKIKIFGDTVMNISEGLTLNSFYVKVEVPGYKTKRRMGNDFRKTKVKIVSYTFTTNILGV